MMAAWAWAPSSSTMNPMAVKTLMATPAGRRPVAAANGQTLGSKDACSTRPNGSAVDLQQGLGRGGQV